MLTSGPVATSSPASHLTADHVFLADWVQEGGAVDVAQL